MISNSAVHPEMSKSSKAALKTEEDLYEEREDLKKTNMSSACGNALYDAVCCKGSNVGEKITFATIKKKIINFMNETIESDDLLSKIQDLPHIFVWATFILVKMCFLAVLVAFTYTGFVNDQSTKYISLDPTDSTYRLCLDVPNSLTGVWYLDTQGAWSGKTKFEPGDAIYSFELNAFSKSESVSCSL